MNTKLEKGKWKKSQEKYELSIVSLGFFIFELLIFISILLGIFYVWYIINYFTLEILSQSLFPTLFEIGYSIMIIILIFLCVEEFIFDYKFPKKRRYNGYIILGCLILFNSQHLILNIKTFLQIEVNFFDLVAFTTNVGIGLLLLFIVLLKSIFLKMRNRLELEETVILSRKTQTIFYLTHTSFIIATVCLVIVALNGILLFSFKGTVFSGQIPEIWDLWNWGAFLRNMLIIMSFVVFFLFVEIRYDLFFDFDDRSSDRIRSWFSRIFRRR